MSTGYTENEEGPACSCGGPTIVKKLPDGTPVLMCFFHTRDAGLATPLPPERPPGWPGTP